MKVTGTGGLLYSDFVLRLLPKKSVQILSSRIGKIDVGFISVRIRNLMTLADEHGDALAFRLMATLKKNILKSFEDLFPEKELSFLAPLYLNEYLLGFTPAKDAFVNPLIHMQHRIGEALNRLAREATGERPVVDLVVGGARIPEHPEEGFYRSLFTAYRRARVGLGPLRGESAAALHDLFNLLIERRALTPIYQPVIDLGTGKLLGWEAFVRGPEDGPFHMPPALFTHAHAAGQTLRLESACLDTVLSGLGHMASDRILFINIHPTTFNDPAFTPRLLRDRVSGCGLATGSVVVETRIPEEFPPIRPLTTHLRTLKADGFKTAIGDAGDKALKLDALYDIAPDYLKLNKDLVRGIESSPQKRKIVETCVYIARAMGAGVIAQGIETVTEMVTVISTGVTFGQGYYIAKPSLPKPESSVSRPSAKLPGTSGEIPGAEASLESLIKPCLRVPPEDTVKAVKTMLADQDPLSCTVVVDREMPVGILMNHRLNSKLSTHYGRSLYFEKPVSRLMDPNPLIVEVTQSIESIAKAAMQRDSSQIYDDIIVTRHGRLEGTISVQKMLDHLAEMQVQIARGANPLTGLPGNVAIEREISRRSAAHTPSSLLYLDLDNFKVYNDAYGFDKGDQLILMTAQAIRKGAEAGQTADTFVGHVGGDDFIVVTAPQAAEEVAEKVVDAFEAAVPSFYNQNDLEKGYIVGRGRDGTERSFPLASLSIGIIDCAFEQPVSRDELSLRVAEIKKYAKSIPGSGFVRDRRPPLGCETVDSP